MKLSHQLHIEKLPTRRAGIVIVKFKYNDIITRNVTFVNIKFEIFATLLIMYKNNVTFLWEVNMSKLTEYLLMKRGWIAPPSQSPRIWLRTPL